MSKTARQSERVTGHPPGMLQDDSRELTAWLANKPDAMRHARDAAARIDGRRVVDCDINGTPILEGEALPLPRYDIPTLDEIKASQGPLIDAIKSGWRKPCR